MALWDVRGCVPRSVEDWAEGWSSFIVKSCSKRAWMTLFFATVWTIWECRNRKVFQDKEAIPSLAVDLILFRVAWWFKHHGVGSSDQISSLLQCVSEHCKDPVKLKKRPFEPWTPPGMEVLKFNVDGSVRDLPGGDRTSVV